MTFAGGDLLGDFLGTSSSSFTEGLLRAFLTGGSGEWSPSEALSAAAFRFPRSRGGDAEGLFLADRACWRGSGETDGLGDCLAAWDFDFSCCSGEEERERLEPRARTALDGGGEAEADLLVRDLVLRAGESDLAGADFRLLGLRKQQDYVKCEP